MCAPNCPVATFSRWSRARSTSNPNSRSPSAAAPRLLQIQIHPAFGVREDAVGQQALQQTLGLSLRITAFHTDQRQRAAAYLAHEVAINMDSGFGYPL